MAYSTSAELLGGPEDGRTIALPEARPQLLFLQHDQVAPAIGSEREMPTRVQTRAATYDLAEHRACRLWQCATMNHHRYTYTGEKLR